jgi:3-deoxy-D-manno-octulosonate 8-phosphate phosphatase (KDO 8-P phosphatase)
MDRMVTDHESLICAPLFDRELALRAARVKVVATDVDGVLTDGGVYYSEEGEALKRFSVRDGMGVERLRDDGIEIAFVTRELSQIVVRRAEKLKVRLCYLGIRDKKDVLPRLFGDAGIDASELAYIGDDVNDAGIMSVVARDGLVGAPLDAVPALLHGAHYRCRRPGGYGAFRDFAEWILELRIKARALRTTDQRDHQFGGLS